MTPPPVLDQEFIIHVFAPLEGPAVPSALQQLRELWAACGQVLGITDPTPGMPGPDLPLELATSSDLDDIIAVQTNPSSDRQAVLRRVHDVLNLSVAFAQPSPEGRHRAHSARGIADSRERRRLGWAHFAELWDQARTPTGSAFLGEVHLMLARLPRGAIEPVAATPELGRALDLTLPRDEDRPSGWWLRGAMTVAGYAIWDTQRSINSNSVREIVVVAGPDRDRDLSAWSWSNGTPDLPPFARYLLHATKLRYQAGVLDSWHRNQGPEDFDEVIAELGAMLVLDRNLPESATLLRSRLERLRSQERRLVLLEGDLARLSRTASIAQVNLKAAAGQDADVSSVFAPDLALAQWLRDQANDDLRYTTIELARTKQMRVLTSDELDQAEMASQHGEDSEVTRHSNATDGSSTSNGVFVVHGRDDDLAKRFFQLLREVHLVPLEWEKLVAGTGSAAPYLGQVVARAPHLAQATLVILSPDDIVELHSDLHQSNDHEYERDRIGQARPNVLFELGLALMAYPDRTVVVEVGRLRPIADLAGLNVVRFDGSVIAVKKVIDRLILAGCPADISGTDWLDPGRFESLAAFGRGPGNHQNPA